jgi:carboxymethylenebutenolidase
MRLRDARMGIGMVFGALFLMVGASTVTAAPYETQEEWVAYKSESDSLNIPAIIISPRKKGAYPVAMYIHGRWGLTSEVLTQLRNLAERGVVVFAPDQYFARAIPALPMSNDLNIERDLKSGIGFLKGVMGTKTSLKTDKIGLIAQDHGGYYATRIAASMPSEVGAYVSIYGIAQNPDAPKAKHIYGYMEEVDKVQAPSLFLIGGEDRQMRRIHVKRVADRMKKLGRTAQYIEYPGAGRCYDWRIEEASLADSLARLDSLNQAVRFMKAQLGGTKLLVLSEKGWEEI